MEWGIRQQRALVFEYFGWKSRFIFIILIRWKKFCLVPNEQCDEKGRKKANKRCSLVPSHFHHFLALETIAELSARASILGCFLPSWAFFAQMQMGEKGTWRAWGHTKKKWPDKKRGMTPDGKQSLMLWEKSIAEKESRPRVLFCQMEMSFWRTKGQGHFANRTNGRIIH